MTVQGNSRSPTFGEVLRAAMETRLGELHVAMPGKIESYDAATQRAEVKPMLMRRFANVDGEEVVESLPVLSDVPVIFPRSGQYFISFPLEPGDYVMLVFNERNVDNFEASQLGSEVDPQDFRLHNLADAVAFPGYYPLAGALKEADAANLVLGKDDGGIQIHMTPGGTVEVKLGGGTAALSAAIAEHLKALYTDPIPNGIKAAFDNHVHSTGVGPSGPPSPQATFPAWNDAIASEKLKLED